MRLLAPRLLFAFQTTTALALAAPEGRPILHLDDVVRVALQRQPSLRQAQASTEAAEGRAGQARSGLFPQVTGTALYERVRGSSRSGAAAVTGTGATAITVPSASGSANLFSFGANANQLLW